MGTKHKHYDVIVAWAAGEEIEWRWSSDLWKPLKGNTVFCDDIEYRIKPKRVKKEGWVNVYADKYEDYSLTFNFIKAHADRKATEARVACIRIEWEEEV